MTPSQALDASLDEQALDLDELERLVAEGPLDFAIEVQERRNILTRTIRYEPVVSDRDERLLNLLAKGLPKLLALARRALARPETTFVVDSSLPVQTAFQLTLGQLVEWSADKVDTDLVMTLLVALAGAAGRGAGVVMDDSGLRAAFDHGFNTIVRDKERS